MKRSRLLSLAELLLLAAAGVAAVILPAAPIDPFGVLGFLLGLTVLAFSDVWLPRGDAVGMSSALAIGALLRFDARVVLVMLMLAEALALIPKGRGQMWGRSLEALAAKSASAVVCSAVMIPLSLHPAAGLLRGPRTRLTPEQYMYMLGAGLLFAALEFAIAQVEIAARTGQPLRASVLGGLSFGVWLIAAQASAGILAALMYRTMGGWGLAITVIMILVMRQSFVLLIEIRQAYNATIDVLIKAMEAQSPDRVGVAEVNASLATAVGREIGIHGRELERLRYAALLLGVNACESEEEAASVGAARIIEGVEFLGDVLPILSLCNAPSTTRTSTRSDLACAYVVMSVGLSTETIAWEQLVALRERVSPRIIREVDRALSAALLSSNGAADDHARGLIGR